MIDKETKNNPKEEEKLRNEIERKIRIITWLLPRFHKKISDPSDYEELIGRVDKDGI
tara:strand:+ start:509 stop:679 length:171 start_codon:yes stop_codon:yes gene_type:complete